MKTRQIGKYMRILTSERDGAQVLYADIIDDGEVVEVEITTSYYDDYLFSDLCGKGSSASERLDACEITVYDCGYTLAGAV